jgi:hypothetical protein
MPPTARTIEDLDQLIRQECIVPLKRVITILDGNADSDVVGMRPRLKQVETELATIAQFLSANNQDALGKIIKLFTQENIGALEQVIALQKTYRIMLRAFTLGVIIATTSGLVTLIITIWQAAGVLK